MTLFEINDSSHSGPEELVDPVSLIDDAMQRFVVAEEAGDNDALKVAFSDLRDAGLFHELGVATPRVVGTTYPEDASYTD